MKISTVRAILAIIIVFVFMLVFSFLVLYPFLTEDSIDLNSFADYVMKISGIYTGIVGVIIGFYFGKLTYDKGKRDPNEDS